MVVDQLPVILTRVHCLLKSYQDTYAEITATWLNDYPLDSARVKKDMRKRFGGMGGLNDIYICKDNAHKVRNDKDEKDANRELRALLEVLWEEVKDPVENQISIENLHLVKQFPTTRQSIDIILTGSDLDSIYDVLVWSTYYFDDSNFIQEWCLSLMSHPDSGLRKIAVSCLGDLYLLRKQVDSTTILPRLHDLLNDPELHDQVELTIEAVRVAGTHH